MRNLIILMNVFFFNFGVSGCAVVTLEESRKKASSKVISCPIEETDILGDVTRTWTATCGEKTYFCSAPNNGISSTIECVDAT